jgi:hypothetical protein
MCALAASWSIHCKAQQPISSQESIERGPHSRTVTTVITNSDGSEDTKSYVALASGLHYFEEGIWKETEELFEVFPTGVVARKGPHKVILAPNANTASAVEINCHRQKGCRYLSRYCRKSCG